MPGAYGALGDERPSVVDDDDERATDISLPVFPPTSTGEEPSITTAHGREWAQLPSYRFIVLEGPDQGKAFSPVGEQIVIGSQTAADIVLTDRSISRFHCEITLGASPSLRDLGSKNGTYVDGVRVTQAPLAPDSVLSLGGVKLRFEVTPGNVNIPLSDRARFGNLVGRSPLMRAFFASLEEAAATNATVLLEGETGTGKEDSAEAIHRESARAKGPFVIVDCGALPPQLLETELFGHDRGSFTGAITARKGAFEAAHGGTIFLDEIGELSLDLQPKLLRVLERKEIKRIGTNSYIPVDVRVVAATNRNLRAEVTARRFRSDLYYRLAVLLVRLPPLRHCSDDLGLLVENILHNLGVGEDTRERLLAQPFLTELRRHRWRGNVRELRNYIERCVATQRRTQAFPTLNHIEQSGHGEERRGEPVRAMVPPPPPPTPMAAPPVVVPPSPPRVPQGGERTLASLIDVSVPLRAARERWQIELERVYLEQILAQHNDRVTAAARAAGVDRIHFYRLLWKHGLRSRHSANDPADLDDPTDVER